MTMHSTRNTSNALCTVTQQGNQQPSSAAPRHNRTARPASPAGLEIGITSLPLNSLKQADMASNADDLPQTVAFGSSNGESQSASHQGVTHGVRTAHGSCRHSHGSWQVPWREDIQMKKYSRAVLAAERGACFVVLCARSSRRLSPNRWL